ncbi:outer membrane protein assembly factor BamC [Orbus sturtevantii]|uniref:outer membrane protein assembly factor BamC n=1 Tax=Orbus sturtevantii TaxID=3074109 RepID=UPI00370DABF6
MFKKTLIIASLLSLFIAGCSNDQRYKREAEGNENYLQAPPLKPLIVPDSIKLPAVSNEYYIFKAAKEGAVGRNLDIRPPQLALPTTVDSYASYDKGVVKFDAPEYVGFWSKLPSLLAHNNIMTESSNADSIKTGVRSVYRGNESQPVEASYLLQRKLIGDREFITVNLISLKSMGQDITDPIDGQYYTVEFFNLLMNSAQPLTEAALESQVSDDNKEQ